MTESEAKTNIITYATAEAENLPIQMGKAFDVAIQALEKQIPKKVQLRHIRKFDGFDDGECPTCGRTVSRDCDGADDFCPDCGQKLDWGDDEE